MISTLADRIGRRGSCLILVGTMWIALGIGIEIDPPTRTDGDLILHEYLPHWIRAALWAGTGLVAVATGARATTARDDTRGFVALMVMPLERALSFVVSWLIWVVTGWWPGLEQVGYERGWYAAVVWAIAVVLLQIISGWRNPPPVDVQPAPDGQAG